MGAAAAEALQVLKGSATHHVFDGALVSSEAIFSQQGEHQPLDAVDVQAHLNRSAVPAGPRATLGSPGALPRPGAVPRLGTGCALCWVTGLALLSACSWQLPPAAELWPFTSGWTICPPVTTSGTTFFRDAVRARGPFLVFFTRLPSAQLLGRRANGWAGAACRTALGTALLDIRVLKRSPRALPLLRVGVWEGEAFQVRTCSLSVPSSTQPGGAQQLSHGSVG